MPTPRKPRKSLSLRLQPNEGTALAKVVDHLNGLDKEEARRKVGEILVMTLLPYAQKELAQCKADSLRSSFLIARGMANNHFGIMALDLDLDAILFGSYSFIDGGINEKSLVNKEDEELSASVGGFDLEDSVESKAKASEVSTLFDF